MSVPQPFSVPDPDAEAWAEMVRRNRLLQTGNDRLARDGAAPQDQGGMVAARLNQPDLPMDDWLPLRGQQLRGDLDGPGYDDLVQRGSAAPIRMDDLVARAGDPPANLVRVSARPTLASSQVGADAQSDFDGSAAAGHEVAGIGQAVAGAAGAATDAFAATPAGHIVMGQKSETPTSRNPVASWAESRVGRDGYNRLEPAADARGTSAAILGKIGLQGVGAPKCNQFVFDALAAGGAPAGRMSDGHIPVAKEWGDPGSNIAGYEPVGGAPQPGDVISNGEHVGIYAPLPDGWPGTVSAGSPWPFSPDAGLFGGVLHNGWGFRGGEGNIVMWRANQARVPR